MVQVLDSWPSSTSFDGDDSHHGGLSSTYSSVQRYAMEDDSSSSLAGFIPTPAGMDVRAGKGKHARRSCLKVGRHCKPVRPR